MARLPVNAINKEENDLLVWDVNSHDIHLILELVFVVAHWAAEEVHSARHCLSLQIQRLHICVQLRTRRLLPYMGYIRGCATQPGMVFASNLEQGLKISVSVWNRTGILLAIPTLEPG